MNPDKRVPDPSNADMSRDHEERVADMLGGRRQPGSGNRPFAKGDVEHSLLDVECKATMKESLRVEGHWLATLLGRTRMGDKTPVLAIAMECLGREGRDWALVPLQFLADMLAERGGR